MHSRETILLRKVQALHISSILDEGHVGSSNNLKTMEHFMIHNQEKWLNTDCAI